MIAQDLNILKSTENHNRKRDMSTLCEQKHLENINSQLLIDSAANKKQASKSD